MKNKNILSISLGVVTVLILGIVVAYAALSTTLNARFNGVTAGDIRWDVGFNTTNPTITAYLSIYNDGSIDTSHTGSVCGDAHVTNTGVTFDKTTLTSMGYCQYTIPVSNTGNVNARLSAITALKPNGASCTINDDQSIMTCGNLIYSVGTYLGSAGIISKGNPFIALSAGETKTIQIAVSYDGKTTTPVTQEGAGFNFNFAQA